MRIMSLFPDGACRSDSLLLTIKHVLAICQLGIQLTTAGLPAMRMHLAKLH